METLLFWSRSLDFDWYESFNLGGTNLFEFYLLSSVSKCFMSKIHTLMYTATRGSVFCPWTLWCADWTPLILFDYIKLKLSTPPPFCQFLQHIVSLHSCFVLLEVSSAGVQHMHEQILSLHRHWADQKLLAVGFLSLVTESIIGTSAMIHSTAASLSKDTEEL